MIHIPIVDSNNSKAIYMHVKRQPLSINCVSNGLDIDSNVRISKHYGNETKRASHCLWILSFQPLRGIENCVRLF